MTTLALVGCAHIHTPGFVNKLRDRGDVKVKTVWDHDAARAKKRAGDLGASATTEIASIWSDPEIGGVIICSETNRHEHLVIGATRSKKHLFVEKPLGMGAQDAYAMADAIEKSGVIFQTGYFMRGQPINLFLRQHVQQGTFGQITRVRASNCHAGALGGWFDADWRWMADPSIAGCGAFGDLGIHALDTLIWLFGPVSTCTALVGNGTARYPGCDETGEGLMKFTSGPIGVLAAAWDDIANPVSLIISGTEAHAAVVNGKLYLQTKKIEGADGKEPWADLPPAIPAGIDAFLDAIAGKPDAALVRRGKRLIGVPLSRPCMSQRSGNGGRRPSKMVGQCAPLPIAFGGGVAILLPPFNDRRMFMASEIKSGQIVRITVQKTINREGARKTLERLFLTDKAVSGPIDRRSRNFKAMPKRRGGQIWTKRPNKLHPVLVPGAVATIKMTSQFVRDLASVASFVEVSSQ